MSLARLAWRQIWRGAVIWAAAGAVIVATAVATFTSAYPTAASRHAFALSLGRLPAFQALYGRATRVDTAGGFVTWRYGDILTVVIALWALLAVTRVMRGDEEAMRAEVLAAAPISVRRLLLTQFLIVVAGCALIMGLVALAAVSGGLPAGGSILFGLMVAAGGIVFGAIAAVTSQLFTARRSAAGWAGAVLGVSYLARALADGSSGLHWLSWFTPLGWTERIEPLTGANPVPIAIIVVTTLLGIAVAVGLRGRRDTGAGMVGERTPRGGSRAIGSALNLDWHLSSTALIAWASGVFAWLFVLGYLTHDMARFASDNPSIDKMIRQIYGFSMGSAEGFLSISFSVVALALAVYAGTHLVSAREEEATGRVDTLVVDGVSRTRWLASRLTIALGAMATLAVVAAVGAWIGANASGASVSLLHTLEASFNVIPAALLFGGLTVMAFGAVPRATAYVAFGGAALAFLIQIVGGLASAPGWLADVSPFSHIAPVPAAPVDATATIVMLVIAAVSSAIGLVAFQRRDIAVG